MKYLVFGSLNIDRTYTVPHFVEAGETMSAAKMELFCGGKGFNQAVALARAGKEVYFAGAVGNLIDRALFGYVTDMIKTLFMNFAVFNFADCCVVVGGILLAVYAIFFWKEEEGKK